MYQVVQRLENMHMYGDEDDGEPKGDIVNYDLLTTIIFEPSCYEQAYANDVWVQSMKEEINSIVNNDTWELVDLPKGNKYVGSKWVYKNKYNSDGSIERYKDKLVEKGFTQKYGISYEETLQG